MAGSNGNAINLGLYWSWKRKNYVAFAHTILPGSKVNLSRIDPEDTAGIDKDVALAKTEKLSLDLSDLADQLYAAGQTGLLVVLQGRDTAGKDGAILHLLKAINVQSFAVTAFKVPTAEELSHDFLWRVHRHAPARGHVALFNRSHYEDVLVARVHKLVPKEVWSERYDHINHFEKLLADSGIIVVKFCLHISREEQERRLLAREADPSKTYKLNAGDWKEREYWDDYTRAYEDCLEKCSAPGAPWHVISADKKWFRNLAITETLVNALSPHAKGWTEHLQAIGNRAKAEIQQFRQEASIETAPNHVKK